MILIHSRLMTLTLGVFLFLLAWLCSAPATYWQRPVSQITSSRVQLVNVTGSIWQGEGQLAFLQGPGHWFLLPGKVGWRVGLSSQGISVWLFDDQLMMPVNGLHFTMTTRGWQLDEGAMVLPLQCLDGWVGVMKSLTMKGTLAMRWQPMRFSWHGVFPEHRSDFEVIAQNIQSAISPLPVLGTYQVKGNLSPLGGEFDLATLSGALQLSGQGKLTVHGMEFDGEASAIEGKEGQLSGLLLLMGDVKANTARLHY